MDFKEFSKEAVCELLLYLADKESFESIGQIQGFEKGDVRFILRRLVEIIQEQTSQEVVEKRPNYNELDLSSQAMSLVSSLSPREEMLLFKSFKII